MSMLKHPVVWKNSYAILRFDVQNTNHMSHSVMAKKVSMVASGRKAT